MDPIILAAFINNAGVWLKDIIGWARSPDQKHEEAVRDVAAKNYETLRGNLTDGNVTILKLLENGDYEMVSQLRGRLYPALQLGDGDMAARFDGEFRYRLEYMRTIGLLTLIGGSEYGITRLGAAFLGLAREKRDYRKVLFS